jgi:hypothetical protein
MTTDRSAAADPQRVRSRRGAHRADTSVVKGLEKLTCIRLAEVLTQKGAVPGQILTDALYAQDRHGEPFIEVLLSTGHVSEWDLAKTVVEQFQVPFLMAGSCAIDPQLKQSFPKEAMLRHQIVPIDRFDNVVTVAMPILSPFEVLRDVARESGLALFPYVGLLSENRKVLAEMFPEFNDFQKQLAKERQQARHKRASESKSESGWADIFDVGDAQVRDSLRRR